MPTRKELSDLYCWIRKNNQHTPDEVLDFMYEAAKEKLAESKLLKCPNCDGSGQVENRYSYELTKCPRCAWIIFSLFYVFFS